MVWVLNSQPQLPYPNEVLSPCHWNWNSTERQKERQDLCALWRTRWEFKMIFINWINAKNQQAQIQKRQVEWAAHWKEKTKAQWQNHPFSWHRRTMEKLEVGNVNATGSQSGLSLAHGVRHGSYLFSLALETSAAHSRKDRDNGASLDEWIKNILGLKIMSSEERFKELNLVYVGSAFHYSEEGSKEMATSSSAPWSLQRAKRATVGTTENGCQ